MEQFTCFVDLDGVGADWVTYVLSNHFKGMSIAELNAHPDRKEMLRKMYKKEQRLFLNLPVMPQYGILLNGLTHLGVQWKILTATGDDHPCQRSAASDKLLWLKRNFGITEDKVIITNASVDKQRYANANSVLIDDYYTNCIQWESNGGHAVHVDKLWYCPKKVVESVSSYIRKVA